MKSRVLKCPQIHFHWERTLSRGIVCETPVMSDIDEQLTLIETESFQCRWKLLNMTNADVDINNTDRDVF